MFKAFTLPTKIINKISSEYSQIPKIVNIIATTNNNTIIIIPQQRNNIIESKVVRRHKIKDKVMEPYWSDANGHAPHSVKYESEAAVSSFPYCTESSLNFSTNATGYSEDDAEYANGRRNKTSRQDPLSHRIIEKRRRDRMNSCLADLSRLIPPQYQRKGRGRIEKTEIIEMAIRHLKHLQSECLQKENEYRMGYTDCMKETAKFLYDSQMQEFCYRLLARLQEHCDEIMKSECFRSRSCHVADNVSASSGSPHQSFHTAPPLCQLRDILGASDIEHSNDHNDVKDLSFRNHLHQLQRNAGTLNGNSATDQHHHTGPTNHNTNSVSSNATTISPPMMTSNTATSSTNSTVNNGSATSQLPHQAPIITSTATTSLHHHTDSSNHDFDSSREPMLHTDTSNMHSPPPRSTLLTLHSHQHLSHHHDNLLQGRLRNFSESSHDVEHNNNYKYKNHIKERFNHELHDEETSSEHCPAPPLLQSDHSHAHSEHSKDGTEPEIAPIIAKKRKLAEAANNHNEATMDESNLRIASKGGCTNNAVLLTNIGREEKPFAAFSEIKTETIPAGFLTNNKGHLNAPTSTTTPLPTRSFAVPIFALHSQGTYYVPLNVDYNVLVPFLNGVDLLEKNYATMPVVHPININVNFVPTSSSSTSLLAAAAAAAAVAAGKQQPPLNTAKGKLEAITNSNGW
ncbi:transcription factor cwo isoform X2 [Glossina fuscipes]|uniref:Transcription factor cwo isoform X2 n=1 Tax=Glossina fuscipes TaxID=7396 RepID=A0A8U0WJX4_9MUSC|nr:transcription factor cwo isoform X2 [Glossina fuscipes]